MRKGPWAWLIVTAITLILTGGVGLAGASPGSTSPHTSLSVLAKFRSADTFGRGPGSRSIDHFAVFTVDGSRRLGDLYGECTTLDRESLVCSFTFADRAVGDAQIVSTGFFSLADDPHVLPIAGGSGEFKDARGQTIMDFSGPRKAIITFELSG